MKKAIIVISFGTSHLEQLEKSILSIVEKIRLDYRDREVFCSFSSNVIIQKLKNQHHISILSVEEALEKCKKEGYQEVIVQPLHLLKGKEYDKVVELCKGYQSIYALKIGQPLLGIEENYKWLIEELKKVHDEKDSLLVFLGHGTAHEAHKVYQLLDKELQRQKITGKVTTLKEIDGSEEIVSLAKKNHKHSIKLIPLMLVAGNHVLQDIIGMEPEKWEGKLRESGMEIIIITKGLGEFVFVQKRFVEHIREREVQDENI